MKAQAAVEAAPLLEARGLELRIGSKYLLAGVDLQLLPGECLGLIGPNGAGKSSLVRALAGLSEVSAGELHLEGRPLGAWPRKESAKRVAYLPQELPPTLTHSVLEVVLMGRSPHLGPLGLDGPDDRELAWAALEQVGASAFAHRSFDSLSGGEKQRVLLARLLAQAAPIWLLDEGTAHLDLAHQHLLLRLARELAQGGGAALCVLHDLGQAAAVCDRLALLAGGRLLAVGTPEEVLRPPLLREHFGVDFRWVELPEGGRRLLPLLPSDLQERRR